MKNVLKSKITWVVIALIVLGIVFMPDRGIQAEKKWTDNYDMDKSLRVLGETKLISKIIEDERARIENNSYQEICLVGFEITKELLKNPSQDEKTFLEIEGHICNEYR